MTNEQKKDFEEKLNLLQVLKENMSEAEYSQKGIIYTLEKLGYKVDFNPLAEDRDFFTISGAIQYDFKMA